MRIEETLEGEEATMTETKTMLSAGRRVLGTAALAAFLVLPAVAAHAQVKSIAILVPEQGTDFGWNQQGVDAARTVAENMGLEFIPAEGLGYGDVRPTLRELAAEGAGLLIAHASGYNTSAPEIAEETGVPVAIVDSPDALKAGLIADYTLSGHDGAYLAGRLAGKMTRTGSVGIVVSGEPPSWNSQSAAFAQGARAEKDGINIIYAVIGPGSRWTRRRCADGGRSRTPSICSRMPLSRWCARWRRRASGPPRRSPGR